MEKDASMPWSGEHLKWLINTNKKITTACGKKVDVYKFNYDLMDEPTMSAWARHFRNHYCDDSTIDMIKSPDLSRSEYLLTLKFPSGKKKPGPSIRAGDFAEILVADYLHFLRSFYIPKTRYDRKIIANESSKGSDIIGFKQKVSTHERDDELIIFEVKAKASKSKPVNLLQVAINHSIKDEARIADSLNAIKQRLIDRQNYDEAAIVTRFQLGTDRPYKRIYGAGAVITSDSYDPSLISLSDSSEHPGKDGLELLVISGPTLMALVHALYKKASDEA